MENFPLFFGLSIGSVIGAVGLSIITKWPKWLAYLTGGFFGILLFAIPAYLIVEFLILRDRKRQEQKKADNPARASITAPTPDILNKPIMKSALAYAMSKAKRCWDETHRRGILTWLMRVLGARRPIQGVWIFQYGDADWQDSFFRCRGELLQMWRYDADGLAITSDFPEPDSKMESMSRSPYYTFCIDEEKKRMVFTEYQGPLWGEGNILVQKENGDWAVETPGWVS